jgi:hypothetical protein
MQSIPFYGLIVWGNQMDFEHIRKQEFSDVLLWASDFAAGNLSRMTGLP